MAESIEASPSASPSGSQPPAPDFRGPPGSPLPANTVVGTSETGNGVQGFSNSSAGVFGLCVVAKGVANSGTAPGVYGEGQIGVHGLSGVAAGAGVLGEHASGGPGVSGSSASGVGIYGKGTPAARFDGNVIINGGSVTMQNGGDIILSDFAEDFDAIETGAGPGTVMVLGDDEGLRPCDLPYDKRVAGVVSGAGNFRPGIVLGTQHPKDNTVPIALVGKVYCKVDAGDAPIEVGDLLTTSSISGHAKKAQDPFSAFGAVIGKALKPLKTGRGLIPILVGLQ